ncbi:MAG: four helix bundle protein [Bacteroidales bacterium]|nr:four helix bundle protein [Bacteroidales bacterium]
MKTDAKTIMSEDFALEVVKIVKYLKEDRDEYIMSKQLLRSGTSIGANIAEANCAESREDFIHKLAISQKEANETIYWLKLLYRAQYLPEAKYKPLSDTCCSLLKLLSKIIATVKTGGKK